MGVRTDNLTMIRQFVPAEAGGTGMTLLLLHGTGGDERDLLGLGRALLPEAALLSPRGAVLENGMPRFFRRLAAGVFDHDDLVARTHTLADFVAGAAARYGFDPRRVIAVGFSNGANIAASALLLRPKTLAGAILLRPMVPFVPETPPDLAGVPVLIASGRQDPIVLPAQPEQLATLLRDAGAAVTLHWEDDGHGLTQGDVIAAQGWLREVVSGE